MSLFLGHAIASTPMAMLTVYCDDSGTDEESSVAVVAGYISNVAQWELFTKEWMKALKDVGINQMHRADLENFQGEFKKWNPERRTALIIRLQQIIKRRTKTPIASMVIKEDFEQFIHDPLKKSVGGVYGFLAYTCLVGVEQWCSQSSRRHSDPIQWVFEDGTKGSHQVAQMFQATYADKVYRQRSRLGGWSFLRKDMAPLQSADLLAYECFKFISNQVVGKIQRRPLRASWLGLFKDEQLPYMKLLDKQSLEFFATQWGKHRFTSEDYLRLPRP
jgi:hypothetical protein